MADQQITGPDELEGVTPVQAYHLGFECGRVSALLESINRRLDAHLLRLGVTQEQIDAAADEALARLSTATTKEEK